MDEYLLFADETKPTGSNPYFCFSGVSISREYYENTLIKEINDIKRKYWGKTDVIFHYSDMKKNKKDFKIFEDSETRKKFWTEFIAILDKAPMDILGIYFNDEDMSKIYKGDSHSNYDIGFYCLLDNYLHYLKEKNICGQICIESRTFKENSYLQTTFYEYMKNGSIYYSPKSTQKYLTSLGFIIKADNCIGLQIADIIPTQLLKYNNKAKSDQYRLYRTLCKKIYYQGTDYEHILGLKNLL